MSKKDMVLLTLLGGFFLASCNPVAGQAGAAPAPKFKEGLHYKVIPNAPLAAGDTVVVTEAFSYMCSHCATFEPYISNWQKRKPANVTFKRIHVVFGNSSWEVYARAYSTAELMGIADMAHGALMDKIWKAREVSRTVEDLSQFYAAFGTDPAGFVATSKSFAVDAKMRKEQRDMQAAGVSGTPSLIVNGKYLVSSNEAIANYDVMLDVVDYLVSLESAPKAAAGAKDENTTLENVQEVVVTDEQG